MFTVYALHSPSFQKIYIGYTSDIEKRFLSHNELGNKGWAIRYRPWKFFYTEQFANKTEAMRREKELKTAKGRDFLWNLIRTKE